jgi:hypothetical protein
MSEAEILSIRNELTDLVISVVSVSFGMISAYIAGLWLFGAIYVALAYLTFAYRWPGATAGPVRVTNSQPQESSR